MIHPQTPARAAAFAPSRALARSPTHGTPSPSTATTPTSFGRVRSVTRAQESPAELKRERERNLELRRDLDAQIAVKQAQRRAEKERRVAEEEADERRVHRQREAARAAHMEAEEETARRSDGSDLIRRTPPEGELRQRAAAVAAAEVTQRIDERQAAQAELTRLQRARSLQEEQRAAREAQEQQVQAQQAQQLQEQQQQQQQRQGAHRGRGLERGDEDEPITGLSPRRASQQQQQQQQQQRPSPPQKVSHSTRHRRKAEMTKFFEQQRGAMMRGAASKHGRDKTWWQHTTAQPGFSRTYGALNQLAAQPADPLASALAANARVEEGPGGGGRAGFEPVSIGQRSHKELRAATLRMRGALSLGGEARERQDVPRSAAAALDGGAPGWAAMSDHEWALYDFLEGNGAWGRPLLLPK